MIPIRQGEDDLLIVIVFVWRIRIMDNQWAAQTIKILPADMSMVPVRSRLVDYEVVYKTCSVLASNPASSTGGILDPGGIGHWFTIAGPSICADPVWKMPWKWIAVVSFPRLLSKLITTRSPMSIEIEGQGHTPLIPIAGLEYPSGDTVTQPMFQSYVTVFAATASACKASKAEK